MTQKRPYPILAPFRLNGRWVTIKDKTIPLTTAQGVMLMQCKKVSAPKSDPALSKGNTETGTVQSEIKK